MNSHDIDRLYLNMLFGFLLFVACVGLFWLVLVMAGGC